MKKAIFLFCVETSGFSMTAVYKHKSHSCCFTHICCWSQPGQSQPPLGWGSWKSPHEGMCPWKGFPTPSDLPPSMWFQYSPVVWIVWEAGINEKHLQLVKANSGFKQQVPTGAPSKCLPRDSKPYAKNAYHGICLCLKDLVSKARALFCFQWMACGVFVCGDVNKGKRMERTLVCGRWFVNIIIPCWHEGFSQLCWQLLYPPGSRPVHKLPFLVAADGCFPAGGSYLTPCSKQTVKVVQS